MSTTSRPAGLVDELQRSHRFTVGVLVSVLLISLLTSGYLILVSQPRISSYVSAAKDVRDLHESMLDQETGLRGWLATGQTTFLEPYRTGTAHGRTAGAALTRDVQRHPELTEPVTATLLARQRWQEWADDAVKTSFQGATKDSTDLTSQLLVGKSFFDDYRRAYQRAVDLIVSERVTALRHQTLTLVLVLVAYLSALAIAGALTVRRRRRLRSVILAPIDDLQVTLASLRSGDLGARVRPTTVSELADVGRELGRLAEDLDRASRQSAEREQGLVLAARRFETLVSVGREIAGSLSVRYVASSVTEAATDLLGVGTQLWLRDRDQEFAVVAHRESTEDGAWVEQPAGELVLRVAADALAESAAGHRAYPLVLAGRVVAVLEVQAESVEHDAELVLSALLSTAAAALESAHLHSTAREQADHDALTQLLNRRRFEVDVDAEWERCRRYGRPMSLVMLDLDHFKRLNDEHGHLVGDQALRQAALAIAGSLRDSDTAYRFGGEEFVVLLRETGLEDAEVVAERLRVAVSEVVLLDRPAVTLTVSGGVAARRATMSHHSDLVAVADLALYEAKRGGRNRVVAEQQPAPNAPVLG